MNVIIPFKQTKSIELTQTFKTFTYEVFGQEMYQIFESAYQKYNQTRASLDYTKIQTNKLELLDIEQAKIFELLKYGFYIDQELKFDLDYKKGQKPNFQWTDTFNNHQVDSNVNLRYDLVAHLYNLVLIYFYQANNMINSENPTDETRKLIVRKCRNGVWCINMIKSYQTQIEILNQNQDFNSQFLSVLEFMLLGFTYMNMYEIYKTQITEFGTFNIAKLINESARNFKMAHNCLVQCTQNFKNIPSNIKEYMIPQLLVFSQLNEITASLKMMTHHSNLVEDEPQKGHFGLALSYLLKANKIIGQVNTDAINKLNQEFSLYFLKCQKFCQDNMQTQINQNNMVYKNIVLYDDNVPAIPSIKEEMDLKHSLAPEGIMEVNIKAIEDIFGGVDYRYVISQIQEQHRKQYEQAREKYCLVKEQKNKDYQTNNVNYCLETINKQNNQQQPGQNLLQKHDELSKIGGIQAVHQNLINIQQLSQQSKQFLSTIQSKIIQEEQVDQQMKQYYQHYWNRTPSSALNKELKSQYEDLSTKYNMAAKVDEATFAKYGMSQALLQLASIPRDELIKQQQQSGMVCASPEQMNKLKQDNDQVQMMVQQCDSSLAQWNNYLQSINYSEQIIKCFMQKMQQDKMSELLLQTIQNQIQQFPSQLDQLNVCCKQTCEDAKVVMPSTDPNANKANQFAQLDKSLDCALDLSKSLSNGFVFYQQFMNIATKFDSKVDDFCFARKMEQQSLIEVLKQDNIQKK